MKKKLFGIGMIVMLILSQVVCVSARSKQTNLWPAGDSADWFSISPASEENVQALSQSDPQAAETVSKINNGEESVSMIADQQPELADQLKNARMLTTIVNVAPVNGGLKTADGDYLLQVSFPGLTSKVSNLCALYYNAVQKIWQVITPSEIDWDNKVVTMKMKDVSDLSFMSMVAKAEVGDDAGSDNTDTTDNANTSDNNSDNNSAGDTSTDGNQTSDTNAGDANNTDSTGNDAGSTDTASSESSTQTSTSTSAAAGSASGSVTGESPKTGVDSDWMLYVCAAGVLLAVSAAAFRKSGQQ